MKRRASLLQATLLSALLIIGTQRSGFAASESELKERVSLMGRPVRGASVTLWQTRGGNEPKRLKTVSSDSSGDFRPSPRSEDGAMKAAAAPWRLDPARFCQFYWFRWNEAD